MGVFGITKQVTFLPVNLACGAHPIASVSRRGSIECDQNGQMSYFPDLTPYAYDRFRTDDGTVLNIGWLDDTHGFPRGDVPTDFLEALRVLCLRPVYLHRGSHECELCGNYDWTLRRSDGNGQIRVLSRKGIWYAAPTMVHHYVVTHQYRPPDVFIDAVRDPSAVAWGKLRVAIPAPTSSNPKPRLITEPTQVIVLDKLPPEAWRIDPPPRPRLSPGTRRRLEIVFAKEDQPAAEAILVNECTNPPLGSERIRYAALKVSGGKLEGLTKAVQLAKADWRDLLLSAGFGEITAHKQWLAEPGTT